MKDVLKRAAAIIRGEAETLRECHTAGGAWPPNELDQSAKAEHDDMIAIAERLEALAAPPAAPEGFVLVPREPTEEMVEAAREVKRQRLLKAVNDTKAGREPNTMGLMMAVTEEWSAMLAAAPTPGERG